MHEQIEQHRHEIARLCAEYGVRRLDVFGSAGAGGAFDPQRSDFDFLVDFGGRREPPDLGTYLRFRDALATLLERRVDLVTEGSVRNPYVRAEIERSREPKFMPR
ncbi:MAG: nucleotidyltransferase domain-containing protein [Halofilum sp. (in: g-proteobacteria)]|nr:nucleotidyltransferase domain-containing protein [Halofilum sp. (in: g-proteobacteria)]